MGEPERNEAAAMLTRAATVEAQRQAAQQRRDWQAVAALEHELRQLWIRHEALRRNRRHWAAPLVV